MSKRTLRGKAAIVGVGETPYYRHGKAPVSEFKLALQAILAACSVLSRRASSSALAQRLPAAPRPAKPPSTRPMA